MRGAVLLVAVAALVAPVVATAADGEPKKALTKAGQTTARSVVLKRADLGLRLHVGGARQGPAPAESARGAAPSTRAT